MKASDSQLRQMFVLATDEVIPPAPWLETQVIDALPRPRVRRSWRHVGRIGEFSSGLRLAAGLVALLIAGAGVAALLMSARSHTLTVPGGRSTLVPTDTFTPSPAVRASTWPPGGPVPVQMAGSWQQNPSAQILHLGAYTFQLGDVQPEPNICGYCVIGNVVVSGSEIDFIDDTCTLKANFGFERFTYTLTGNTLVLTRAVGSGQSACRWLLAGTYTRVKSTNVQTPSPSPTVTFTPSPAVRASNWPPGGTVPAELAGPWQSQVNSRRIDLGGYTFQVDPSGCGCGSGNVVVNRSEIYFMTDTCTPPASLAPVDKFGYEQYSYTLSGNTMILVRAPDPGQSNCGFSFQGTYTKVASS
jgi:hypothetical protein